MAVRIVEGTWEDVAAQIDLHGRHVRVLIDDANGVLIREIALDPAQFEAQAAANPWLRTLEEWAKSHVPLKHAVDDSRDTMYEELVRDPR